MTDTTWCAALPDHAVDDILDALHDCKDSKLRPPLEAELWRRHAVPITLWPASTIKSVHPKITLALICAARGITKTGTGASTFGKVVTPPEVDRKEHLKKVTLDLKARTGFDPAHRPVARLDYNRMNQVECSCGYRGGGKLWRSSPTWWWPVEMIDGIPHYIVCQHARGVDDACHAPNIVYSKEPTDPDRPTSVHCICGYDGYWADQRRLLPAY